LDGIKMQPDHLEERNKEADSLDHLTTFSNLAASKAKILISVGDAK